MEGSVKLHFTVYSERSAFENPFVEAPYSKQKMPVCGGAILSSCLNGLLFAVQGPEMVVGGAPEGSQR